MRVADNVGSLILGVALAIMLLWAIGFSAADVATWGELVGTVFGGLG